MNFNTKCLAALAATVVATTTFATGGAEKGCGDSLAFCASGLHPEAASLRRLPEVIRTDWSPAVVAAPALKAGRDTCAGRITPALTDDGKGAIAESLKSL